MNWLPHFRDFEMISCSKVNRKYAQMGITTTGRMPSVADPVIMAPPPRQEHEYAFSNLHACEVSRASLPSMLLTNLYR